MLIENVKVIKSCMPKDTKFCAVIKADGYGLGDIEMVKSLNNVVDYFAVATIEEREGLNGQSSLPIMILSPLLFSEIPLAIKSGYEFTVGSLSQLSDCLAQASNLNIVPKIHLKIDSGMHRFGFSSEQFLSALETCQANKVDVKSIYSHFANTTSEQIAEQKHIFDNATINLRGKYSCHISASFGATCRENLPYDMVRCGLAMLGTDEFFCKTKCVIELLATIIDVKVVAFGDFVGYNYCNEDVCVTKIAVVRIGYGDGFSRSNSKVGVVYLGGLPCKIVGNICMDVCFIDVSNVPCSVGDIVKIIRFEKAQDVALLAKNQNTIPYEITTALSNRVKRVFID